MIPYLLETDKAKCCCCGSCAKCCPTEAIVMVKDEEGFFYPVLNSSKCVKCGKCSKICQYSNSRVKDSFDTGHIKAFAAKLLDEERLKKSSSGGGFWALASAIISQGGVVYGAAWIDNHQVCQCRVDNIDALSNLQGSKYVFCNLGDTYQQTKNDLLQGRKVLYTGTPCHINGLYAYLGKDYSNLYTCDLICHGVPSQQYLSDFIQELEKKYDSRVVDIKFKDKSINWRNPSLVVVFENGQQYKEHIWSTAYGKLYHNRLIVMNACNYCQYATLPRRSDITLGDFWKYDEDVHQMGSEILGVSSILANTEKGIVLLEESRQYLQLKEIELDDAMQLHLQSPAKPASKELKERFMWMKARKGFIKTSYLINKLTYRELFKRFIYRIIDSLRNIRGQIQAR